MQENGITVGDHYLKFDARVRLSTKIFNPVSQREDKRGKKYFSLHCEKTKQHPDPAKRFRYLTITVYPDRCVKQGFGSFFDLHSGDTLEIYGDQDMTDNGFVFNAERINKL